METLNDVRQLVIYYESEFPNENIEGLKLFLDRCSERELYDRKLNREHITSSALIIDPIDREILMLQHRTLGKLLQPGGHIEECDNSILSAALREALEETGISQESLVHFNLHASETIPFDIDSHVIPENPQKHEPEHYHHDFRYLFFYKGTKEIKGNPHDSTGVTWIKFSDLSKDQTFRNLIDKIRKLLSLEFKTKLYYDTVVSAITEKKNLTL
jgi:8-oxo-dGTP pyrophosphatase MutT (NUDIX family)